MQKQDSPATRSGNFVNAGPKEDTTMEPQDPSNPQSSFRGPDASAQDAEVAGSEGRPRPNDDAEIDSDAEEAMYQEYERSMNRERPLDWKPPSPPPYKKPYYLHSFGKVENMVTGVEPKIPRSFLEGRENSQMKEILGRGYGEEDWYEGEAPPGNEYATWRKTDDEPGTAAKDDGKDTEKRG
jgi:hypothetical protein